MKNLTLNELKDEIYKNTWINFKHLSESSIEVKAWGKRIIVTKDGGLVSVNFYRRHLVSHKLCSTLDEVVQEIKKLWTRPYKQLSLFEKEDK